MGGGGFRSHQLYTTDIDERIEHSEEWLNAGSRLRLTNQLSLEFGVEDRKYRWGESAVSGNQIADELDRDSTTYKGGARLRLSALTDLVASAERLEDTFLVAPPSLATTISYRYLAGFEFGERAFMTGRILAGVRDIPAESAGSAPTYRGPAVQAALIVPFLQRLRLTAGYDRDVYYSAEGGAAADTALRNTYTYGRLREPWTSMGPWMSSSASPGATNRPTTSAPSRRRTARSTVATRSTPRAPACCGASAKARCSGWGRFTPAARATTPAAITSGGSMGSRASSTPDSRTGEHARLGLTGAGGRNQNETLPEVPMLRACRYLLAVGLVLASLPAAAQPPAAKARAG